MIKLYIEAIVSENTYKLINKGFVKPLMPNSICAFVSYSDFEVAKGYLFKKITAKNSQIELFSGSIELYDITQQLGLNWDSIPIGWKTICILKFDKKIEDIVFNFLSIQDSWGEAESCLIISD